LLTPGSSLIITDEGREEEVVTRLARVGFDNTLGYLKNGIKAWLQSGKEIDRIESISAQEFDRRSKVQRLTTIDVRKPGEFEVEHMEGAISIPLDFLNSRLAEIPKEGEVYVYCAGGYRSMIAVSILKSRGWDNLIDVKGGFKALAETDVPCTDYVCTKTEKKKK
jgi:rhodanese-related sulfurtransferase